MELSDLDQYRQTRTLTEKLRAIFDDKCSEMEDQDEWIEYLDNLEGVEHIRKFSTLSDTFDLLFDVINKEPFNRMIIEDEAWHRGGWPRASSFILIDRDFANVVLALGELP